MVLAMGSKWTGDLRIGKR